MSHLPPYRNAIAEAAINRDLEPRRRKAKKHPLRIGDTLQLNSPSLRSDVYPTTTSTQSESTAGNRRRSFNHFLLNILQHGPEDEQREIVLTKALQTGKDQWSQVWQAEIAVEGKRERVVLKLFVEALFPYAGENGGRIWRTAEDYAAAEGDSYAAFSDIQGSVVPVCYGVCHFKLPFLETVIGILLEDLTSVTLTLSDWITRLCRQKPRRPHRSLISSAGSKPESELSSADSSDFDSEEERENVDLEDVKPVLNRLFSTLSTLHDRNRVYFSLVSSNMLLLGETASQVTTVFIGFSQTLPRKVHEDDIKAQHAVYQQRYGDNGLPVDDWRSGDEYDLEVEVEQRLSSSLVTAWKAACREGVA